MYTCIAFDVDGTLIDTEAAILSSLQIVLKERLNRAFSLEELTFALGIPGEVALMKLGIKDIPGTNERWNELFKKMYDLMRVFDGIEHVLIRLHEAGIKTGIVTSKTREELWQDFKHFDLQKYFPYIVCADDTERYKPFPDPLQRMLEMSQTDLRQALYVGDTIYDMQCAHAAGVDFGLAVWGSGAKENMAPQYLLGSPADILEIIQIHPLEK